MEGFEPQGGFEPPLWEWYSIFVRINGCRSPWFASETGALTSLTTRGGLSYGRTNSEAMVTLVDRR